MCSKIYYLRTSIKKANERYTLNEIGLCCKSIRTLLHERKKDCFLEAFDNVSTLILSKGYLTVSKFLSLSGLKA